MRRESLRLRLRSGLEWTWRVAGCLDDSYFFFLSSMLKLGLSTGRGTHSAVEKPAAAGRRVRHQEGKRPPREERGPCDTPFPGYLAAVTLLGSLDLGAGRRCPLRFSGEAPQDVDRARFVALGLAAAALLVRMEPRSS